MRLRLVCSDVFAVLNEIMRPPFYFGVNLSDVDSDDSYGGGDDASYEPQRGQNGGPALYGVAADVFKQNPSDGHNRQNHHAQAYCCDEVERRHRE